LSGKKNFRNKKLSGKSYLSTQKGGIEGEFNGLTDENTSLGN
jgi:hypothetical protein